MVLGSKYGGDFNFWFRVCSKDQASKMLKVLKYMLRIFGIKMMENKTKMFGDNNSIILNSPVP